MSMVSLCSSQLAASPACVASSSRIAIPRPPSSAHHPQLPAPGREIGLGERCSYGGASASGAERIRPVVVAHAAKWGKKRTTLVDRWTPADSKKKNDGGGDVGDGASIATSSSEPSPASTTTTTSIAPEPANWKGFAARVSGEWDGYSAEFNMFGEPLELPENVVPDAFREWGQQVHDWQTQCPTLAHPKPGHLWYKAMKLHPTVGCEADAATVHSTEERDAPSDASALAYHTSGSYTSVWPGKSFTTKPMTKAEDEVEVEQCLVHDKVRIRVFQKLGARRHILICREAWEGPFRNGESLGGCAAANAAFATEKKLDVKEILGKWNSEIYTLKISQSEQGYTSRELVHSDSEVVERTWSNTFLYSWFPKGTWTLLLKTESGGTTIETGWLPQPDVMLVTKCDIGSSGDLKEVSLRVEKRISREVASPNVSAQDLEELLTE